METKSKEMVNVEIDLFQLLYKIWFRKFLILLIGTLFATSALLGSIFLITPKYLSTTRIYVVNSQKSQETSITAQDLVAGSYLTKDYQEIIKSKDVMQTVILREGLDMSPSDLSSKISVSIPNDTRVISISVSDENPNEASDLANAVREVASEKIKEVTKVEEVTTIEAAEPSSRPSSPNIRRNIALGMLVGVSIGILIVLMSEVLDDTVKRADDIEEILGVPLLGVVPNSDKL